MKIFTFFSRDKCQQACLLVHNIDWLSAPTAAVGRLANETFERIWYWIALFLLSRRSIRRWKQQEKLLSIEKHGWRIRRRRRTSRNWLISFIDHVVKDWISNWKCNEWIVLDEPHQADRPSNQCNRVVKVGTSLNPIHESNSLGKMKMQTESFNLTDFSIIALWSLAAKSSFLLFRWLCWIELE